jgi:5-methylcytosine-specific restriction protein A
MKKKNKLQAIPGRLKPADQRLANGGSWRDGKQSSAARGYDYQWQLARAAHLEANPLCVMCKARGVVTAATVVDHIRPHRGDMLIFWDRSNWQSLCKPCHDSEKQRIERATYP